jgi:hypothetical protein
MTAMLASASVRSQGQWRRAAPAGSSEPRSRCRKRAFRSAKWNERSGTMEWLGQVLVRLVRKQVSSRVARRATIGLLAARFIILRQGTPPLLSQSCHPVGIKWIVAFSRSFSLLSLPVPGATHRPRRPAALRSRTTRRPAPSSPGPARLARRAALLLLLRLAHQRLPLPRRRMHRERFPCSSIM